MYLLAMYQIVVVALGIRRLKVNPVEVRAEW
jgi:hypothetical protein